MIKRGDIITLEIERYAFGGKGIGKIETDQGEMVVFVPNTIPGQKVEIRVEKKKKKFLDGKLLKVIERSKDEIEIPYQEIPGAPYARLPIEKQQAYKKESVLYLFKSIGKIDNPEELMDEFISSPSSWHYRNKMEYSFSIFGWNKELQQEEENGFYLGFKRRGTWWCAEDLNSSSGLFDEEFENKLHLIREKLKETGKSAWSPKSHEGFFRYLIVRKSFLQNKFLLDLVVSEKDESLNWNEVGQFLKNLFNERLAGFIVSINGDIGDRSRSSAGSNLSTLITGEPVLEEELLGLTFEMSMKSFFQPNPKCAEKLYQKGIDYLKEIQGNEKYYFDLYCGTGTIAQLISKNTDKEVIGVEIVEEAIENAKNNAIRNTIKNASFYAEDVNRFLFNHPEMQNEVLAITLDPPRAGMAKKALKKILNFQAKGIVYISCNPATQARDLELFKEAGYELKKFTLVDQFPHTSHIESVALLEKS